jgi:hypothetical protein
VTLQVIVGRLQATLQEGYRYLQACIVGIWIEGVLQVRGAAERHNPA